MKSILLPFCTFCTVFSLVSRPPLEEVLQATIKNPNYSFLNPINGAQAAEDDSLKDVFLKGDKNDVHHQLLRLLFVVEEGDEFLVTSYNPYGTFTPQTISMLICKAFDNSLFELDENKKYCAFKEIAETYAGPNSPKRMEFLIQLIHSSLEKDFKMQAHTTFSILLAFLYLKCNATEELQQYTDLTSKYLNIDQSSDREKLQELQDAQGSILQKLLETKAPGYRPPALHWRRDVKYASYKPISNCCETVINTLLNNVLFDHTTQSFNLLCLQEFPALRSFYTKHSQADCLKAVDSYDVHEDCMAIVSNLSGIEYRKEHYEIEPGILNILNCIATLFNTPQKINSSKPKEQAIKKICNKISQKAYNTLRLTKSSLQDNDKGDVHFEIKTKNPARPSYTLLLCVRKDHAWITY